MKKLAGLFFATFVLLYANAASAQSCNDPSGFIKSYGQFNIGDGAIFGPGCQQIQSGNSSGAPGLLNGNNIWTGNNFFGSGKPWCDIVAKGGAGDGSTDNAPAFTACIAALASTSGGTIYIPPSGGTYCVKSNINIPAGTRVEGASIGTILSSCGSGNTILTLNGNEAMLTNIGLFGPGVDGETSFGATNSTLIISASCIDCVLFNVDIEGGSHAIQWNSGEAHAYQVKASLSYGTSIMHFYAANGSVAGGNLVKIKPDQNMPNGQPVQGTVYAAWQSAHTYALVGGIGPVVTVTCQDTKSYYVQLMSPGISGGAFPNCKNYGQNITDGTAVWQLAFPNPYYHWQFDSNSNELDIFQSDTGGGTAGFILTNTVVGGGNDPTDIRCVNCNGGGGLTANFWVQHGANFTLTNPTTAGCISTGCANILLGGGFTGGAVLQGGSSYGSPYGIQMTAGADVTISGMRLTTNTIGIDIENASNSVTATGNDMRGSSIAFQAAGTTSDLNFTGNVGCVLGSTTCAFVTSSGSNIITSPNDDGIAYRVTPGTTLVPGSTGDTFYRDSGGMLHALAIGSNGNCKVVAAGLPAWATCVVAIGNVTGLGSGVAALLAGAASGSGGPAGSVNPVFTTPNIGVAAATSVTTANGTANGFFMLSPSGIADFAVHEGAGGNGFIDAPNNSSSACYPNCNFSFRDKAANTMLSMSNGGAAPTLATDWIDEFNTLDATSTASGGASHTYAGGISVTKFSLLAGGVKYASLAVSPTAPTISSGFCTSPSVASNNGTAAFSINVGSACAASSGVIGLPTAAHGWKCDFSDITTPTTNKPDQTAGSVSSVTMTNFVRTTGIAGNFTSADVIAASCTAY